MMMKNKGNRGAALISVLIGIMFITILSTSLIYMAMMNHLMKTMRYYSTDNFYTAEFGLNDLTAKICQFVDGSDDCMNKLDTLLKRQSANNKTIYDVSALNDWIDVADKVEGLESISVNCIYNTGGNVYSADSYVKDGSKVTLRGVQVIATTDEEHGSYESTITTDIEFYFPAESDGDFDINDFSVMADMPMSVATVSQAFGGCVYLKANDSGNYALRVDSYGVVYCFSKFAFMDGDVNLVNGGSLFVTGNMYINGNLQINNGSQLYVTGKLYVRGKILGTGLVVSNICDDDTDYSAYTNHTDTFEIFVDGDAAKEQDKGKYSGVNWAFYDSEDNANGLASQVYNVNLPIRTPSGGAYSYETSADFLNAHINSHGSEVTESKYYEGVGDVKVYFSQSDATDSTYQNSLIFGRGDKKLQPAVQLINSTYINLGGSNAEIRLSSGSNFNYWGSMDDDTYEIAKSLIYGGGDKSDSTYVYAHSRGLSTMDLEDPSTNILLHDGEYKLDGAILNAFYSAGTSNNQKLFYGVDAAHSGRLYIPAGYFIKDDSSAIISKFVSGGVADSSTGTPIVKFTNWTKE